MAAIRSAIDISSVGEYQLYAASRWFWNWCLKRSGPVCDTRLVSNQCFGITPTSNHGSRVSGANSPDKFKESISRILLELAALCAFSIVLALSRCSSFLVRISVAQSPLLEKFEGPLCEMIRIHLANQERIRKYESPRARKKSQKQMSSVTLTYMARKW